MPRQILLFTRALGLQLYWVASVFVVCGAHVLPDSLWCRKNSGQHSRHSSINNILAPDLQSSDTSAQLEPPGLARSDGKRPDGVTLIPCSNGRCLIGDFTCADTLAPSLILKSSLATGSAALEAEVHKESKYSDIMVAHTFVCNYSNWKLVHLGTLCLYRHLETSV